MTIILGIDPGSRITGFGVIESRGAILRHIASGSLHIKNEELATKLQDIFLKVSEVIATFHPEEAAVEQVFVHANANSALKLGQARGAALVALASHNLVVAEYAPRQIKQAVVGYGHSEKHQVQKMVKLLLKLKEIPTEDGADALAIAICHAHMRTSILKNKIVKK